MPVTATNPTLLTLDPITVPPYSARGIVQTLDPIPQSFNGAYTVDGELLNLSSPTMRKFRSVITCRDLDGPALSGVWPGDIVTVGCIVERRFITATGAADRPMVAGSLRTEGIYSYFRPLLVMKITTYTEAIEEYPGYINWQMELLETA